MRKLFVLLVIVLIYNSLSFAQETNRIKIPYSLSNAVAITGEAGATIGKTDYKELKPSYMGKFSLEYFFPSSTNGFFSFRLSAGKGFLGGKYSFVTPPEIKTAFHYIGGSFAYTHNVFENLFPFIDVGISNLWVYPRDINGVDLRPKFTILGINGNIGIRFMVSENFSFNISSGFLTGWNDKNDDQLDAQSIGLHNDWIINSTLGISYYFNVDKDRDGDNIIDSEDMCPSTPPGVQVDEFGCPVDSDRDGVADYLDRCPKTPVGAKVDSHGCPLDSDGDGIADYFDRCPNTPGRVRVDAYGCPLDSDHDGVPDFLDKCLNTQPGTKVDNNGCKVETKTKYETLTLGADASFNTGQAVISAAAYPKLNKLVKTMKAHPELLARISGHTDSIGKESFNLKLSKLRATAVAEYLIGQGITKDRLVIIGYGETRPVASNSTPGGRSQNRRVEIKLFTK